MKSTWIAALVLATLGAAASAQTRKEMADRVVKQYDAPSAACAVLSNDEVVKITGRRSYQPPIGTQLTHGSACDYDSANLTLFSGPQSAQHYDALLKNFKRDTLPRQAVAGVGDSAFLMVPPPGDRDHGRFVILVVRQGVHTMAVSLQPERGQTPQALQPTLMAMAKTALGRLR